MAVDNVSFAEALYLDKYDLVNKAHSFSQVTSSDQHQQNNSLVLGDSYVRSHEATNYTTSIPPLQRPNV